MAQMKAFRVNEGERKASLQDVDISDVGSLNVLVKVKAAGLQLAPLNMAKAGRLTPLPETLGHAFASEVHQVGESVENSKVGDRIRVHPMLSCWVCDYCLTDLDQMCVQGGVIGFLGFSQKVTLFKHYRDGSLAEYVRVSEWLVDRLPDNTSFEVGSKIQELSTAYSVLKRAKLNPGSTIIVTAPTGAMGVSILKVVHLFGVRKIILVRRSRDRLEGVRKLASLTTEVVATESMSQDGIEKGELIGTLKAIVPSGADTIIDLLSSGTLVSQAIHGLRPGGVLVHLGSSFAKLDIPLKLLEAGRGTVELTQGRSDDSQVVIAWSNTSRRLDNPPLEF